ncbi:MAG: 50S ribosomal protein L6 [Candidatus Giovannonibacteria bacterium]|nr:MAG: 50S ribosomal protein L6 [Candidatus Giovannonibacteria bacterium]
MSRLAKKSIKIPEGVSVNRAGDFWLFNGPKGELKKRFPDYVDIKDAGGEFKISLKENSPKEFYPVLGTAASIFKSAILGVKDGYEKKLEIEGVGYKAQLDGKDLSLSLGFTHPVKIPAPEGVAFKIEKNMIVVSGADKEKVGEAAANIRAQKRPEPYKGKGIHYAGEIIRRKAGKKAVAAA